MIKGYRKGICNELIQLTDYIEILAQVVGIEVKDLQMRDSNLPSFLVEKKDHILIQNHFFQVIHTKRVLILKNILYILRPLIKCSMMGELY